MSEDALEYIALQVGEPNTRPATTGQARRRVRRGA